MGKIFMEMEMILWGRGGDRELGGRGKFMGDGMGLFYHVAI